MTGLILFSILIAFFSIASFFVHQLGFCFSRGTATVINFTCFILFIPMCKTWMTMIKSYCTYYFSIKRNQPPNHSKLDAIKSFFKMRWLLSYILSNISSLLDQCKKFHILCSYTLIVASSMYTLLLLSLSA